MNLPDPIHLEPDQPDLIERLSGWRGAAGVYVLTLAGADPHLGSTTNLERRLKRLLLTPYSGSQSLIGRLRQSVASVECWPSASRLETALLLYFLGRRLFPANYLKVLRLRMPWFVGLVHGGGYPRLEVTNRLPPSPALFGPFVSRGTAQQYEQELAGLFQIRRCVELLSPSPDHPGCIYGEMNQCLRPCQGAVSRDEYGREAERVADLLASNGKTSLVALSSARERACEELDFEQAAQIHRRIEKIQATAALRDSVIQELSQLSGLALTPARGARSFTLWPMLSGIWQDPLTLSCPDENHESRSLDAELRQRLSGVLSPTRNLTGIETTQPADAAVPLEQLAVFSRWYYSSWRDGEWFPLHGTSGPNYRKLVRGISKLIKSPAAPAARA